MVGTVETPASSPPRWASTVSDTVLGEDRDPLLGAQIERPDAVGDPVERLVDLGPPEGHTVVAERDLVGSLVGQARGDPAPPSGLDLADRIADVVGLALDPRDVDDPGDRRLDVVLDLVGLDPVERPGPR